jgi:AcrR family transcriptional regulator
METTRNQILEAGFRFYSANPIESIGLPEIAEAAGCGRATLYRYYNSRPVLAVAIANWKMAEFYRQMRTNYSDDLIEGKNAAERFGFYLDAFIDLYRSDQDLLRFLQFFNIYIKGQKEAPVQSGDYLKVFTDIAERFHNNIYLLAQQDGTVRTDIPEEEMFTAMTHLMMAAVTRFAMGLIYLPENSLSPEEELQLLKQMILRQYCL